MHHHGPPPVPVLAGFVSLGLQHRTKGGVMRRSDGGLSSCLTVSECTVVIAHLNPL